nr:unnamed protein product [Digitaria exilis]
MHSSRHNAVITFAKKSTKRESRDFRNKSKNSLLISEEASSGSEGSTSLSLEVNSEDVATDEQNSGAPRSAVLQACTLTSGLLLAGGLLLRQVSHLASLNGWPIADPTDVSCKFFSPSSQINEINILTSLEPLDYIVVACLPGISEELLFRGALMPILGLNWISALLVGTIFGALHLGNGRKYSFAIWATFVGFAYGIGTIASSSVIVPMVSHSLNNIIGGLLWQFTKNSQK